MTATSVGYVSSQSVYVWGSHTDERSPVVEGSAEAEESDYAADKRGGELAWDGALWLRAGLILGPYEDIGRLPWWLARTARGGDVVAPGRPERPLQYVDVRDLATFTLDLLARGVSGPVDVTSLSGHATTRSLLEACVATTGGGARLRWVPEERLAAAGVEPWTQLPCWVPEDGEFAGFLEGDASYAASLGLVCRPVEETVADTWAWLRAFWPARPAARPRGARPAGGASRPRCWPVARGARRGGGPGGTGRRRRRRGRGTAAGGRRRAAGRRG